MNAPLDPQRLIHPSITPAELVLSSTGGSAPAAPRAVDVLDDIVSLKLSELFPEIDPPIVGMDDDREATRIAMRRATEAALADVDFSMIGPEDTVNIMCSDHGFTIMGGWAYADMLKAVKDIVEARTGNKKLRLVYSCALMRTESIDIMARYGLEAYFNGRVAAFWFADPGIGVDTEIGKLYLIKKGFNAKWLIHCHYDSPREMHFHRFNGRALKSFAMSYARMETRSLFHNNFGPRSANIVPRAIYESDFIQKKFVCGLILTTAPTGITNVLAGRDFIAVDKRMTAAALRNYGKLYRLLNRIDAIIPICDSYRYGLYQMTTGISMCALFEGSNDHLDLDASFIKVNNPAVKSFVLNNLWVAAENMMEGVPKILSSQGIADAFIPNMALRDEIFIEKDLPSAVARAKQIGNTDNVIIFDGSYGSINVSRSLAEQMLKLAPEVSKEVDEVRMPKWLKQRGLPLNSSGLKA